MRNNPKRRLPRGCVSILTAAFWLLVWQLGAMALKQEILLVSPVSVLKRWFELIGEADFWRRVAFSSLRIAEGLAWGMLAGALLGAAAARCEWVRVLLAPLVRVIRAIPVASFIILALFWLSKQSLSAFISFLICFPVFYTNLLTGVKSVDGQLMEMADVYGLGPLKRLRYLYFPAVHPYLVAAANVSVGLAWKSGIAAEVIAVPRGSIGDRLYAAKVYLETGDLLAWTLTIVLLSLAFEGVVKAILRGLGRGLKGEGAK